MQRRKVLLGIGGLAASSGLAIGSGAFTTVDAERSVEISAEGDASAFLALAAADSDRVDDSGDTIQLDFVTGENSNEYGINQDATTTFESALEITNNGTNSVTVDLEMGPEPGTDLDPSTVITIVDSSGSSVEGGISLDPGTSETVGFEFDMTDDGTDGSADDKVEYVNNELEYILITAEA